MIRCSVLRMSESSLYFHLIIFRTLIYTQYKKLTNHFNIESIYDASHIQHSDQILLGQVMKGLNQNVTINCILQLIQLQLMKFFSQQFSIIVIRKYNNY